MTRVVSERPAVGRIDPVVHARPGARASGPLDEVTLSRYERDGFLWLEGFFRPEQMAPFLAELGELSRLVECDRSDQVIRDRETGDVRSVFGVHAYSERFRRVMNDPWLLGIVEQLLGSRVYVHQSRINDKAPFRGGGFRWHSDFETWHAEDGMPRMRAVSASVLLTENNEFNGPLMLIPGSHHQFIPCVGPTPTRNWERSLQDQRVGVPNRDAICRVAERGGMRAPKGPAGSLLLFECNVLHASNPNMSPWRRSNLFFVYNSVENGLTDPFAAPEPRPTYLATRGEIEPCVRGVLG